MRLHQSSFLFFCLIFFNKVVSHSVDRSISMRNCIFDFFGKLSISLSEILRLKNRIPSEISTTPWLNYTTWRFSNKKLWLFQILAHISDYAHSICCFILKRLNHFGESFRSYAFKEPLYVRSRESLISIKAKRGILYDYRLFGLLKCKQNFLSSNFFRLTL